MQIIKQPDGRFAVRDSTTEKIVVWGATHRVIVNWFAERAAQRAREEVERLIGHVAADEPQKAYCQFAVTWEEALDDDQEHDGDAWRQFRPTPDGAGDRA